MKKQSLISICIPSYNRPDTLIRLLKSIDAGDAKNVEIVICEDKSPKREEIRVAVEKFKKETDYEVVYKENKANFGFDKNLRELIKSAKGDWIIFMGDDDDFVPQSLDKLINFLKQHPELGYVLKSHLFYDEDKKAEKFRYYETTKFFESGLENYVALFRKSVFISGFIIKRELVLPYLINEFDGTLLFQLYLLAEVVLKNPSAYFDEPLTRAYQEGIQPLFGTAESEKKLYTPGTITIENSINFLKGFFKITEFIDKKYNLNSTASIKKDMSKYFYPSLAIQRNKGIKVFLDYVKKLNQLGFNITFYYYLYTIFLLLLGKRICDNGIRILKNILGRTPKL